MTSLNPRISAKPENVPALQMEQRFPKALEYFPAEHGWQKYEGPPGIDAS
jgi:hypothetical protein